MSVMIAACILCLPGCGADRSPQPSVDVGKSEPSPETITRETELQIEAFCGDCHALPRPESFDRDRWHFEIRRGFEFYSKSGRSDLHVPPFQAVLAYYRARAPEELTFPVAEEADGEPPVTFEQQKLSFDHATGATPEFAALLWAPLVSDAPPVLLATDMRHGHVMAVDLKRTQRAAPRVLAVLRNPGRLELADLDGDGQTELLVADLGSYLPAEHHHGRVMLLQGLNAADPDEPVELLGGLARVADVKAAELDGDGKPDLIVAEFGWRETGRLLFARNVSGPGGLEFELHEIDDRPGALDVRLHDFTGDGLLDPVVLFSQEYESIDLFRNWTATAGRTPPFVRDNLWSAPDLTFGSSGMDLADLNGDGLMDILCTNGDSFDNDYVSPWHGVQWLENRGDAEFLHHRLTEMPGAYCARAGDFDGDNDLDIVVVSRLPPKRRPDHLESPASIALLVQTEPGRFDRYTLEWDLPCYSSVAVGDFDANGTLDFAVAPGPYVADLRNERGETHSLSVWWNAGPTSQSGR